MASPTPSTSPTTGASTSDPTSDPISNSVSTSAPDAAALSDAGLQSLLSSLTPAAAVDPAVTIEREKQRLTQTARVVIVDDEPINVKLVRKVLQEVGFVNVTGVTDSTQAIASIREAQADIVLLDLMMPHVSGLDVLTAMRASVDLQAVPVIVLTASADRETKLQALEAGATEFLSKPVDRAELIPRVRNALTVKAYYDNLRGQNDRLEAAIADRKRELAAAEVAIVHSLARAAEFRDDVTGRHVIRVGRYAGLIARQLGFDETYIHRIELAAQLHDVGKIGVSDSILNKPAKLDADEFLAMQRHCQFGRRVLEHTVEQRWDLDRHPDLAGYSDSAVDPAASTRAAGIDRHAGLGGHLLSGTGSPLMQMAGRIAMTHHERWDGSGYPLGLAGEDIPIEGRITAAADVLDAMSSARPYKPAYPLAKCLDEMESLRGQHFDPDVLDALHAVRGAIVEIQVGCADIDGP